MAQSEVGRAGGQLAPEARHQTFIELIGPERLKGADTKDAQATEDRIAARWIVIEPQIELVHARALLERRNQILHVAGLIRERHFSE